MEVAVPPEREPEPVRVQETPCEPGSLLRVAEILRFVSDQRLGMRKARG
jgi:hypothetical protein